MHLLYWPVIIVLSISVANVVSESQGGTSGLTARTIVPSPTPDCWSPSCLTWSQCLADPSQCFTSHTTVTMLPGEYRLHEHLGVYGVVSLSIYGSRSEVNGSTRENQVVINCEYREGGIGFMDVANFSLSGITLVYCGVQGEKIGFIDKYLLLPYFALYISVGFNVNFSFLFITNSTQVGLLCINLLGTSGIHDSVITHSNYRLLEKYMQGKVNCSMDNWECRGSNMWILYLNPVTEVAFNTTNLVVERTRTAYGVNLRSKVDTLSSGAGIVVLVDSGLKYYVHLTIVKCCFVHNIDKATAHLHLGIKSSCSVLVKDSNFTYGNRIMESDPMKLVPWVQPDNGTVYFQVHDVFGDRAIYVEIVMNEVQIAENVGGGLFVTLFLELPQSYIELRLKKIEVVHNLLIQDKLQLRVYGNVVRFEELIMNAAGGVNITMESAEISNNVLVSQNENVWTQELLGLEPYLCAFSIIDTQVHFKQTRFFNNSMPVVYSYNSDLHFHGVNIFKNNTGRQCGGALVLRTNRWQQNNGK